MSIRAQGTSAGLDRRRIAAALTLVDCDGLERFGVRRLAQGLEVDPMPIHHCIKGRTAPLDAMSEAVRLLPAPRHANGRALTKGRGHWRDGGFCQPPLVRRSQELRAPVFSFQLQMENHTPLTR